MLFPAVLWSVPPVHTTHFVSVGDNVTGHTKAKVSDIHCFLNLVHPAHNHSTEDNQVGQVQFELSKFTLPVLSPCLVFLLSGSGFYVDLLCNIPRKCADTLQLTSFYLLML